MAELNDKLITYGNLSTFYNNLKLHDLADKQDALTAGQNIDITNDTISAKGYKYYDDSNYLEKIKGVHIDGIAVTDGNNFCSNGVVGNNYATCFGIGWKDPFYNQRSADYTFSWETDATTITCNQDLDTFVSGNFKFQIFPGMVLEYNNVLAKVSSISGHNITLSNSFGEGQTNVRINFYDTASTGIGSINLGPESRCTGTGSCSVGYYCISDGYAGFSQGYNTRAKGKYSSSFGYMCLADNEASTVIGLALHSKNKYEFVCGTKNKSHFAFDYSNATELNNNWGSAASGGNTLFSVGCGVPTYGASTGWRDEIVGESAAKKNAIEVMQNADMYVKGIGGYDGVHIKTETGYESTKTLQEVISGIDTSISGKQDALTAGSNITISNNVISATDTTYSDATTSASGLMSAADKTKLNGIEANAEVNVIEGVILSDSVSALTPDANKNVTIPLVTTSSDGLMSAEDKAKLDGLEAYTVATTAEIEALFAPPTPVGPAANEIWYTTSNNSIVTPGAYAGGSGSGSGGSGSGSGSGSWTGPKILSNVYEDGKGVITFAEDLTELPDYAFNNHNADYDNLTSVILPDSVTSIGIDAFSNCIALTTVIIPADVTVMNGRTFEGCHGLTSITCKATTPPTLNDDYVFDGVPFDEAILYVPSESINDYKADKYWSYIENIQAISE